MYAIFITIDPSYRFKASLVFMIASKLPVLNIVRSVIGEPTAFVCYFRGLMMLASLACFGAFIWERAVRKR
jgi:hypothetical protein